MKKLHKRIEIVCSTELGLSSMSQASRQAILGILSRQYTKVDIILVNTLADLELLASRQPDLVFLGMKFLPTNPELGFQDSNKIWISEFLDRHNIAYTGSGQLAHELELDKSLAKRRVLDASLRTSPFYVVQRHRQQVVATTPLSFPLFVKPTDRGGGLGIDSNSVVHSFDALRAKVASIAVDLQSDSLVEEYLPGREFSVAILKDEHSAEHSVMPLELIAPPDQNGARLLSAQIKSADTERFMAVTDKDLKAELSVLAIDVFYALGARDYGRIDIRLDKAGVPQFLEANLIPSLIKGYGNFPKACMLHLQLDYEPMILHIARLGLARSLASENRYQSIAAPILSRLETITA